MSLLSQGDWNAKVGSQEIPGVTGKFGPGVQNKAGQRLPEFCQENTLVITNTHFQQHKRRLHMNITRWSIPKSDWLYSLRLKTELYTVSKNWEVAVAQVMNTLLPNSDWNWRNWSWTVLWRPTRPFRTNTQKRCPFHYRGTGMQK